MIGILIPYPGYSGADMANLCREAALGPIRTMSVKDIRYIKSDEVCISLFTYSNSTILPIEYTHLLVDDPVCSPHTKVLIFISSVFAEVLSSALKR